MGKFDNLRHRPFMLVTVAYRPKDGVNTNIKGWQQQDKSMQVIEKVDFHDRVSDRHLSKYTAIIDLFRGTVITHNIVGRTNQEVFDYFTNKYRNEVNESVGLYMKKLRSSGKQDLIMKEMNEFIERFKDIKDSKKPEAELVIEEKGKDSGEININ